tara:strand:+ start:18058 stop:18483 length:426 start_codon:yes stop_codon:yes gene_type:complete
MSTKSPRETKQRNAIRNAFNQSGRPLGPKEVLDIASQEVPNLGIATVYRNIKAMVENGDLEPVELPGQPPRYYFPQSKKPPIFICSKTNRVFHFNDDNLRVELPNMPEGFSIESYEIILHGTSKEGEEVPSTMKSHVATTA